MFYTILSSIIDKYKPSWVQKWRTGATVPQRKAGHDVVQFDHFGQGRHGDGALVVATAPENTVFEARGDISVELAVCIRGAGTLARFCIIH